MIFLLLCVIDIYSKYVQVVPLRDKNVLELLRFFKAFDYKSGRKPNKIWVDIGSKFYNRSM